MDTWVKFQIDYIERQLGRKFNTKEKKLVSWFLKLPKSEQTKVVQIENFVRKNNCIDTIEVV